MYRLFSLSALLIIARAEPRVPKIYNVLISTKKNLAPSHALPVYEPVLRTTSVGIGLPSIYYPPPISFEPNFIPAREPIKENGGGQQPPVQSYIPYYSNFFSQQGQAPKNIQEEALVQPQRQDPKQIIANLKKNSDIPDVPPPALPTRSISN